MQSLASIAIFARLSPERCQEIGRLCDWRHFAPGSTILHYGDESDHVAFLTAGRVRVRIYSATGKAVSYRDLGAGEVFGEFAAIDGGKRSASIEALESSEVALLGAAAFRQIIASDAAVAHALLLRSVALNRALTERVRELATLDVGERVACELIRLSEGCPMYGDRTLVEQMPTHQEIADRIGTTREGVTKKLKHLERDGYIARHGPHAYCVRVEPLRQWLAIGSDDE